MLPTLTLEQQFQFLQMKQAAEQMNLDQLIDLLIEALRQLQIKTNLYFSLCKTKKLEEAAFSLTMEQSLKLRLTKEEMRGESRQGIQDRLLETMQVLMHRDNDIKEFMCKGFSWRS
jgi:hypothetical protein